MKAFSILGGLFLIIFICLIPLKRDLKEYEVQKEGQVITAIITYIPNCVGTKGSYFMRFKYEGKDFTKKVGCSFRYSNKVGDSIKLKHINGTDIFLFEEERKETEFISTTLIGLVGVYCIFIGLRNKNKVYEIEK